MTRILLISLGGAVGSAARYFTSVYAANAFGTTFAYGTLIVNVVGSFLIAFVMHAASSADIISPDVRLMLTTGVLGGFTTYSSFNYETTQYFRAGTWGLGALNLGVTVIGCLLAGLAGLLLARLVVGP